MKVDEYILDAKSNFRIKAKLEGLQFNEEVIPTGKQLSNRRTYLRKKMFEDFAKNTKGGFIKWIIDNHHEFSKAGPHDFMVLSHKLENDDFVLVVSTKSLLNNGKKKSRDLTGFVCSDTTHKLISCQLKLTTVATATINREIADIAYVIHAHENIETFNFAFTTIKKAIKDFLDYNWKVKVKIFFYIIYFF